jgi:hypothetical protein
MHAYLGLTEWLQTQTDWNGAFVVFGSVPLSCSGQWLANSHKGSEKALTGLDRRPPVSPERTPIATSSSRASTRMERRCPSSSLRTV